MSKLFYEVELKLCLLCGKSQLEVEQKDSLPRMSAKESFNGNLS